MKYIIIDLQTGEELREVTCPEEYVALQFDPLTEKAKPVGENHANRTNQTLKSFIYGNHVHQISHI